MELESPAQVIMVIAITNTSSPALSGVLWPDRHEGPRYVTQPGRQQKQPTTAIASLFLHLSPDTMSYQMPQSPYAPPAGAQIQPGDTTYTTSTGADGQITYHLFKAVRASYQTPQGVVHGIQWIPAEATLILPAGAQPADAQFAASWNRSRLEDKRRKKEEKDSLRRLSKQFEKDREETERYAQRERRRSFYETVSPSSYGPSHGAYTHSPNSVTADLDRKFNDLDIDRERRATAVYSRTTTTDRYTTSPEGYPMTTSPYRPSAYTTSPGVPPKQISTYPGAPDPIVRATSPYARASEPIARAPSPYGRPPQEPIARAASPYGRPPQEPFARAASPYGRPPQEPIGRSASPYGRAPTEPIARATSPYGRPHAESIVRAASPYGHGHSSFVPRAPSPIPPPAAAPYARGPPSTSYPRAPSPYMPPAQMYPVGHVMEGQPLSRSRAPSPMPGPTAFPVSPRVPIGGLMEQQLTMPEAFSRHVHPGTPFMSFPTMKIQNMEQFYDQIPRMPLVLDSHDVYHPDWIRFMNDLALAWAGKLPIPIHGSVRRSELVADLIDLWNASFFRPRGVEAVLYRGRERRSGPHYGTIDHTLPAYDLDTDDFPSSDSSDSDDLYPGYAHTADRQREIKAAERRRKEQKARRKAKEHEKTYALYITSTTMRDEVPTHASRGYYA